MRRQTTLAFLLAISLCASGSRARAAGSGASGAPKAPNECSEQLRALLIADLRSAHNQPEWFMPLSTAIAGLTPEQAKWIPTNSAGKLDPNANHSE